MKRFLLNLQFYPLFFLFSAVGIPILALFVALFALFVPHRTAMRRFRRAIGWYGWVIIRILLYPWVRVRYENCEPNAGPGPFLFVCNHRSTSDPFLLAVLPHEVIQVVNVWPFRLPVLGFFARCAGYLSVRQMSPDEFIACAARHIEQGVSIAAFPEGTRSGSREMGPFHGVVFRLALQTGVPIVPLCISGNERIPPRGSGVLNPGNIRVRRLPAMTGAEYRQMNPFQLKNRVRERIAEELDRMEART